MQVDEETQVDGNYSSTLTTVTVEPAGLSPPGADYGGKMRLLLVRATAAPGGGAAAARCCCAAAASMLLMLLRACC